MEIESTFQLCGTCNSFNDLKDTTGTPGEVVVDISTNNIYAYINNVWMLMCESDNIPDPQPEETVTKIINMKCDCCGAPLIRYNRNATTVKCEYCGSVFDIREVI